MSGVQLDTQKPERKNETATLYILLLSRLFRLRLFGQRDDFLSGRERGQAFLEWAATAAFAISLAALLIVHFKKYLPKGRDFSWEKVALLGLCLVDLIYYQRRSPHEQSEFYTTLTLYALIFVISSKHFAGKMMSILLLCLYTIVYADDLRHLSDILGLIILLAYSLFAVYVQHQQNETLKRRLATAELEKTGLRALFDQFPQSIAVFDKAGSLVTANTRFCSLSKEKVTNFQEFTDSLANDVEKFIIDYDGLSPLLRRQIVEYQLRDNVDSPKEANHSFVREGSAVTNLSDLAKFSFRLFVQEFDKLVLLNRAGNSVGDVPFKDVLRINCFKTLGETTESLHDEGAVKQTSFFSLEISCVVIGDVVQVMMNVTTQHKNFGRLQETTGDEDFKNRVLNSISHELRTPLNGMLGLLESGMSDAETSEHTRDVFLAPVLRCAKLLNIFVANVVDLSQVSAKRIKINLDNVDIRDVVTDVLDLIVPEAEHKQIDIHVDIDPDVPRIFFTDRRRLGQILLNLLFNAVKFTQKGSVTLTVNRVSLINPSNTLKRVGQRSAIEFTVEDSGIGITDEAMENLRRLLRAMDVGQRVSYDSTGCGVGLTVSQILVLLLGGEPIAVESAYGSGSKFSFHIVENVAFTSTVLIRKRNRADNLSEPMVNSNDSVRESIGRYCINPKLLGTVITPEDRTPQASSNERTPIRKSKFHMLDPAARSPNSCKVTGSVDARKALEFSKAMSAEDRPLNKHVQFSNVEVNVEEPPCQLRDRILIVDDDSFNILSLKKQLDMIGFDSVEVYDGQQSIDKMLELANSDELMVKLIIMDFQMPNMNGHDATKELKRLMREGKLPLVPIIGCSAFTSKVDVENCYSAGMDRFLCKPVELKRLEAIVKECIPKD